MNSEPQYGPLATTLAALQQKLTQGSASSFVSAVAPDGALRPKPRRDAGPRGSAFGLRQLGAGSTEALLIGASKTQPVELLEAAILLGLKDFGENKVQEAQAKWPLLKEKHPQVRLHLIGPLQSNKAMDAVALFDIIQTVDRPKIADALAAACLKLGKHPQMLIQVNTGEEPQKAGVAPREVPALLAHCRALNLSIVGLMCVPPDDINHAPHFALMNKMAAALGLRELSMGMSGDFESAIRLGATMVRIGTALFGSRE